MIDYLTDYPFFILFFIDLILFCINCAIDPKKFHGKNKVFFSITKSLLLILLMIQYYEIKGIDYLVLYLILHLIGDIFLICTSDVPKEIGTFSFLVGHIWYIYNTNVQYKHFSSLGNALALIPISFMWIRIVPVLFAGKSKYRPLIGYLIVLSFTMFTTCQRLLYMTADQPIFYLEYIGKLFFILSDSILIENEAKEQMSGKINIPVVATYAVAQFFIVLQNLVK